VPVFLKLCFDEWLARTDLPYVPRSAIRPFHSVICILSAFIGCRADDAGDMTGSEIAQLYAPRGYRDGQTVNLRPGFRIEKHSVDRQIAQGVIRALAISPENEMM
jgi:hypothetical protein